MTCNVFSGMLNLALSVLVVVSLVVITSAIDCLIMTPLKYLLCVKWDLSSTYLIN